MNVVITGSTGRVGSAIASRLKADGHTVLGTDIVAGEHTNVVARATARLLASIPCDLLFHFAAGGAFEPANARQLVLAIGTALHGYDAGFERIDADERHDHAARFYFRDQSCHILRQAGSAGHGIEIAQLRVDRHRAVAGSARVGRAHGEVDERGGGNRVGLRPASFAHGQVHRRRVVADPLAGDAHLLEIGLKRFQGVIGVGALQEADVA